MRFGGKKEDEEKVGVGKVGEKAGTTKAPEGWRDASMAEMGVGHNALQLDRVE